MSDQQSKPMRIQRQRIAGWRMPPNTVSVTRPGKFGNPFRVTDWLTLSCSLKLFEDACHGIWNPRNIDQLSDEHAHEVYEAFCIWRTRLGKFHPSEIIKAELRGKNLACFCPLDKQCHASVLLEIANS